MKKLFCILLFATFTDATESRARGQWDLHSSFRQNLHQTLMHDATAKTPRDLSGRKELQDEWKAAVAACREACAPQHHI